jgi:hypothetical protein
LGSHYPKDWVNHNAEDLLLYFRRPQRERYPSANQGQEASLIFSLRGRPLLLMMIFLPESNVPESLHKIRLPNCQAPEIILVLPPGE